MDLIFHIGTEKAGSTSIQSWLDDNSEKLRQDGIFYCRSLLRPNNLGVYLYGLGGGFDDGFAYLGAISDDEKSQAVEKFRRDFLAEVAEAKLFGAHTFVISNEHCHSRLKSLATIQRVHDLLRPLFDNIAIWCFLRPQIDVCVSLASTLAAGGIKITKDLFRSLMHENEYYFNYNKILFNWAQAFGKDNIKPISFKSNTNTVRYFLDSLSLNPDRFSRPKQLNTALDYRAIALSTAMAMEFYLPNGRVNRNSGFFIGDLPVNEKLTLDRSFAIELQGNFSASNAELVKSWHTITPEDLEPDVDKYPVTGNLDRISNAGEFGDYFRFVVERFNALLWLKTAEHKEAESKVEELKGNLKRSLGLCEEALSHAHCANEIKSVRGPAIIRIIGLQNRISELKSRMNGKPINVAVTDNPP